jgi:hypothetical protein
MILSVFMESITEFLKAAGLFAGYFLGSYLLWYFVVYRRRGGDGHG